MQNSTKESPLRILFCQILLCEVVMPSCYVPLMYKNRVSNVACCQFNLNELQVHLLQL